MTEKKSFKENEKRIITSEEYCLISPVLEELSIPSTADIYRFIDSKLDKIYNVFLICYNGKKFLVKKTDREWNERPVYDKYFKNMNLSVAKIYEEYHFNDDVYLIIEYIEGYDARNCSCKEATLIGSELAKLQSTFLCFDKNNASAQKYFERRYEHYFTPLLELFPELEKAFKCSDERYFTTPLTLIHDDLLPINVLLSDDGVHFIDWETADIRPYFLDLARFAFVNDENEFYISKESADSFLDSYYKSMTANPLFQISKQQFCKDVAISALWQYGVFVDTDLPKEEIIKTTDYQYLCRICEYIMQ